MLLSRWLHTYLDLCSCRILAHGLRDSALTNLALQTNLPKFRTTQFRDVRRLHSEFVKLGEHLISACPEAIVPAVPPATTSAGAGTDEDEARLKTSIQRRLYLELHGSRQWPE